MEHLTIKINIAKNFLGKQYQEGQVMEVRTNSTDVARVVGHPTAVFFPEEYDILVDEEDLDKLLG